VKNNLESEKHRHDLSGRKRQHRLTSEIKIEIKIWYFRFKNKTEKKRVWSLTSTVEETSLMSSPELNTMGLSAIDGFLAPGLAQISLYLPRYSAIN